MLEYFVVTLCPVCSNIAEEAPTSSLLVGNATALYSWSPQHNNQLAFQPRSNILVRVKHVSGKGVSRDATKVAMLSRFSVEFEN